MQELFDYPGSKFTSATLTGHFNHDSIGAFADYAWRALVTDKGYFTFAPVLVIGLAAGLFGRRRWGQSRGAYLVLLWGSILSLVVTLLMTNNFGGAAVGFRHAAFVCPSLLALMLPLLATPLRRAAASAKRRRHEWQRSSAPSPLCPQLFCCCWPCRGRGHSSGCCRHKHHRKRGEATFP